mgnify:CR=1 FL=1
MSLRVKKNVKKYELIYKKGQNHFYPNLDLVRIQKSFLKNNIGKTLDYGFGSGENLVFLNNEGHEIYGLETSITALKITKKKIKNKILKSNLKILKDSDKLNFKENFFDNIICLSVFSQLKNKKNAIHLLKEFNRILKINGILIIDINGPKSENFYKKKDFFSLKNKKEFLNILKKNNFEIINHGEVYKSYLNIKDHEFLAIAKKIKIFDK